MSKNKNKTTNEEFKNLKVSDLPEYSVYYDMLKRCYIKTHPKYKTYGARNITVCDRWREDFFNFLEDMGFRPSKEYSIERIDNNKGYSKENCKWATRKEQANNRRTNVIIFHEDKKYTIKQASEAFNINYSTLYSRLFEAEYSVTDALGRVVKKKRTKEQNTSSM